MEGDSESRAAYVSVYYCVGVGRQTQSQMQPAHCSPLQSATNAPWVVSKWFERPLRHLSPEVPELTTSPDTSTEVQARVDDKTFSFVIFFIL